MSRPSSRLSGVSRVSDQQHARNSSEPASSLGGREREREHRSVSSSSSNATILARPHSSLSSSSAHARVPFTPGANSKISKIANLGLSAKQVDKLSESIANIQRGPSTNGQQVRRASASQHEQAASRPVAPNAREKDMQDRKGKARGRCLLLQRLAQVR